MTLLNLLNTNNLFLKKKLISKIFNELAFETHINKLGK